MCGAPSPRRKLHKDDVEILQCSRCQLAFWTPDADFHPEAIYDGDYFEATGPGPGYDDYGGLEQSFRLTSARRLARLPAPAPGGRLLDVGAAYGYAVSEAAKAGWRSAGLEVSHDAARHAGAAAPERIFVGTALSLPFASDSFDIVTMWDVLEHLADPHRAVAEIARVLRPGGTLGLSTGDVGSLLARISGPRWHLYSIPEHLFFYSRKSLRELLADHGLRVEHQFTEASIYTLGYLVERLRKTLLGRRQPSTRRWPGWGLRIPVNLFDIVTVHAIRET